MLGLVTAEALAKTQPLRGIKMKEEFKIYAPIFISLSLKLKIALLCIFVASILVISINYITSHINLLQLFSLYFSLTFMFILAVIDTKLYIIPNSILLIWLITRVIFIAAESFYMRSYYPLITSLIGACIIFFMFLAIYYLTKRSLGGGDVKLSFILGLSVSNNIFTVVFYALILSALFSIIALLTKKLSKKDAVPLGPFLFLGTVLAYLAQIL